MTDTYTSAGLIKQEYDTNDNTWGDLENTNKDIQQLLIAGYSSQDLSAGDVTLPDLDGTADAGKAHMYVTTGTIPANRNLIVPTKPRHFKVKNNCSGDFTVTVKTAAGTGVVVPAGGFADLVCDGTNVVEAVTSICCLYGDLNLNDNTITRPELKDYAHTAQIVASSGTAQTIDIELGNTWVVTMDDNCTFTLSNPVASGSETVVRLKTIQDATGGRTHTFAGGTFKWLGQTDQSSYPTITTTTSYVNEFEFRTTDGGTTWTALLVGSGSGSGGGGGGSPTAGIYVAVGSGGSLSSSTDGVTWTLQATQFSGSDIRGIDTYNGRFHFYKNTFDIPSAVGRYTTNGTTFTSWGTGSSVWLRSTALCSNGNAVMLDIIQGNTNAIYSVNNWTTTSNSSGSSLSSVAYYGAINSSSNEVLWCSASGSAFYYTTSGVVSVTSSNHSSISTSGSTAAAYLNGQWLIADTGGKIYYKSSVSAVSPTLAHTMAGGNQINKFLYTGTKWIAAGNAGVVSNSSSIGTWSSRTTGLSGNITDIANNGAIVVVVTDIGEVARSADNGDSWSVLSVPTNNPFGGSALYFVKFRLTKFWAGGAGGKLGQSSDGSTFSLVSSGFGSATIYDMEAV